MDPEQAKKSYATDEVALRAKQLYEHEIRERVEPEHSGRYLVVDVESGDYEPGSVPAWRLHPHGPPLRLWRYTAPPPTRGASPRCCLPC